MYLGLEAACALLEDVMISSSGKTNANVNSQSISARELELCGFEDLLSISLKLETWRASPTSKLLGIVIERATWQFNRCTGQLEC